MELPLQLLICLSVFFVVKKVSILVLMELPLQQFEYFVTLTLDKEFQSLF